MISMIAINSNTTNILHNWLLVVDRNRLLLLVDGSMATVCSKKDTWAPKGNDTPAIHDKAEMAFTVGHINSNQLNPLWTIRDLPLVLSTSVSGGFRTCWRVLHYHYLLQHFEHIRFCTWSVETNNDCQRLCCHLTGPKKSLQILERSKFETKGWICMNLWLISSSCI